MFWLLSVCCLVLWWDSLTLFRQLFTRINFCIASILNMNIYWGHTKSSMRYNSLSFEIFKLKAKSELISPDTVPCCFSWIDSLWRWKYYVTPKHPSTREYAVAPAVEALRYNSEGRGFDSRWCHWSFFYWHYPCGGTVYLESTQSLTEMSVRYICWGVKAAVA